MQGIFRLALLCILFAACAVWHSGKVRKLSRYAAPDDLRTSRRRTGLLLGGYAAVALLFGGMVIAPAFSEYLRFERGRYEIVLEMNSISVGTDAWTAAVAACRVWCAGIQLSSHDRADPLPSGHAGCGQCSALPGCNPAVVLRVLRIVSFSPSPDGRPLVTVESELNAAMAQLLSGARMVWAAGTVLLMIFCVVLRLTKRCGVPLPPLLSCAALQSLLWYVIGTSDQFLLLHFPSVLSSDQSGLITILTAACFFMLMLSLLIWAICTLLSGVRRKPVQTDAPQARP